MTSKKYNFTSTLVIKMDLGVVTLYWIPCKRAEPQRFFLVTIEKQLPVGVRNVRTNTFLST